MKIISWLPQVFEYYINIGMYADFIGLKKNLHA